MCFQNKRFLSVLGFLSINLVIILFICGCAQSFLSGNKNGTVQIGVTIPTYIPQAETALSQRFIYPGTQKAKVTITADDITAITETKSIAPGKAEISFELLSVPTGKNRLITLSLYDIDDTLLSEGTTTINIEADIVNKASITAIPKKYVTLNLSETVEVLPSSAGRTLVYAFNLSSVASHTVRVSSASLVPTIVDPTGHSIKTNQVDSTAVSFNAPSAGLYYAVIAVPADLSVSGTIKVALTDVVIKSDSKAVTAFTFASPPALGIITGSLITVTVPYGTNITALVPGITHTGASISPASGIAQDFTNPVVYTLTAEDGSTQIFTVMVTIAPNSAKQLTSFGFTSPPATGVITGQNVLVTVPSGTNITALVPSITHTGASISPASGTAQNFTNPVAYTVTAANGTTQIFTVTVTVALNTAKQLTSFGFTSPVATGVITGQNILVSVPFGTNVTALIPGITHTGASISPASGVAKDFTNPVAYTVTAEDGSTQIFTVTVTVASNAAKEITSFSFTSPVATGIITGLNILVTVPFGTNVTALVPTLTHTGASISPNYEIPQNFSSPKQYTVTAVNGTTAVYTVTVEIGAPSGYSINFSTAYINMSNQTNASFTFTNAIVGTTYAYVISSSGGGTPVTGSGSVALTTQSIDGINLSGLADGTVTVSATLSSGGKTGSAAFTSRTKDTMAPMSPATPSKTTGPALYCNSLETTILISSPISSEAAVGDTLDLLINGTVVLTHTVDATDMSAGYFLFITNSATFGSEGTKTIAARETDMCGNVGSVGVALTIEKDITPPTFTVSAPSPLYAKTGTAVTYYMTVSGAATCSVTTPLINIIPTDSATGTVSVANGETMSPSIIFTAGSGDGTLNFNFFAAVAYDAAENPQAGPSLFTSFIVDNTPPVVNILTPTEGQTVVAQTTATITGSAGDALTSITLIEYSVNGGTWMTTTPGATWSISLTGLNAGSNNLISVRATDTVGNTCVAVNRNFTTLP